MGAKKRGARLGASRLMKVVKSLVAEVDGERGGALPVCDGKAQGAGGGIVASRSLELQRFAFLARRGLGGADGAWVGHVVDGIAYGASLRSPGIAAAYRSAEADGHR